MTRWALVSSEQSGPRTKTLLDVVERLGRQGLKVAGFVQRRTDGDKGFEVVRLPACRERVTLAQKPMKNGVVVDDAACDYLFEDTGFKRGLAWIEHDAPRADLVVLDVVSKMETYGQGHGASMRKALELGRERVVLVGARASQVDAIINAFSLDLDAVACYLELPADDDAFERFVGDLARACRDRQPTAL